MVVKDWGTLRVECVMEQVKEWMGKSVVVLAGEEAILSIMPAMEQESTLNNVPSVKEPETQTNIT